ncbi:MAG: metallophosphoesterase family protein [Desulfobacterales bacterium]
MASETSPSDKTLRSILEEGTRLNTFDGRQTLRLGIISDTHGYLPQGVSEVFHGMDLILHAGDIDKPGLLESVRRIAPVAAVKGNMDTGGWAAALKSAELIEVGGVLIFILHDRSRIDLDPLAAGIQVVISGHTHRPEAERDSGVFYLNPGSASFPRFGLLPTVAILEIRNGGVSHRFIELPDDGQSHHR